MEQYALKLLKKARKGKSAQEIAAEEGVPLERIQMRLDAATAYEERIKAAAPAPQHAKHA
ncbi:MAG: hypothetical protein M1383_02425 [Patescibacteria group bacterium]|nr:hypothetical protein [Patescibacteria group bacterium]